jgi:hypothetical protein
MKAPLMEWIKDRLRSKQPTPPQQQPVPSRPPSEEELRREEEVRRRIDALDHWAEAVREDNKEQS